MAQSKTMTLDHQYLSNANSPTSVSYTVQPEVSGGNLVAGHRRVRPGVFTAGTPSEEYGGANVNQESNG